jgi:hypothetical protein
LPHEIGRSDAIRNALNKPYRIGEVT